MSAKKRRLAPILGVTGAFFALAALLAFRLAPEPTAGDPTSVEASLGAVTTTSTLPAVVPGPTEAPEVSPAPITPNQDSLIQDVTGKTTATPIRLRIGAIEADAPVILAGVDNTTGQMEVPDNVDDVAWYKFGPSPGESGSAVLAAHVDLAGQGRGVFFNLRYLEPGDSLSVTYDDGSTRWFRVEARAVYDKDELPLDAIFSRSGSPVLTLITCGGGFNPTLKRYDSNVVVYAVPEPSTPNPAG